MNFIAVKVTNANGKLRAQHASFVVESLGDTGDSLNQLEEGGVCYVGIRPEDVKIVQQGEGIPTTVYATEPLGGETIVDLELGRQVIKSIAPPTVNLQTDARIAIRLDAQRIHVFDAAGRAGCPQPEPTACSTSRSSDFQRRPAVDGLSGGGPPMPGRSLHGRAGPFRRRRAS